MPITRRAALLSAAAVPTLATAAAAQDPARFHRERVGELEVTMLQEGAVRIAEAAPLVAEQPPERVIAALEAAGISGRGFDNPYTPVAVRTRDGLVLIDTGFGPGGPAGTGKLFETMRAAGLDPAAVATVIITHFHGDHISGLLGADGAPAFPRAVVKVPEREWSFWMDEGEAARSPDRFRGNFANARRRLGPYGERVQRFAPGAQLAPGITAVDTRGHAPGHSSVLIADGNAQLLVIGDAITTPAFYVANPDWHPVFDMDPPKAIETRKRLLERAARDRIVVTGYHFPYPATGRVEPSGSGYRIVPSTG